MYVKRLQNEEVLDGLHLVWEVFAEEIAASYTPQGVQEFQAFIKLDNIMPKVQSGELNFWGVFEQTELCGVIAVRRDGHVSLLFVKKKWQRQGAAKMLFTQAYQYCTSMYGVMRMTVNAAPQAVEMYRHLGFHEAAPVQTVNGITFVPMERMVAPGDVRPVKTGKSHKGLFIGLGVGAAVLALLVIFGVLFGKVIEMSQTTRHKDVQEKEEEYPGNSYDDAFDDNGEDSEDTDQGIEAIPCYEEEDLSYTIEEETYTYQSTGASGEYPMEFDIHYPQIKGLENGKTDEINKMLKDCAMSTVDTLYLNPSEELKEAMLQEKEPFMASQVTYKVTYAGKDFISVAFSDHYFSGSYYAEFQDLRTRNIRLSDAARYETEDIVDLSDEFMKDWLVRMKGEAPNSAMLKNLRLSQFRQILGGEILENRYYDNFFVDADGIEIGMTYHYSSDEAIERGWITAPFSMKDIEEYKNDSDFWKLVKY